jgi:hypothetical protein
MKSQTILPVAWISWLLSGPGCSNNEETKADGSTTADSGGSLSGVGGAVGQSSGGTDECIEVPCEQGSGGVSVGGSATSIGGTAGECADTGCETESGGATGGAIENGTGGTPGRCDRSQSECSAALVTILEVELGHEIANSGREGDTEPLPLAIAPTPVGGSWVAALGTEGQVFVAELDCEDQLLGTPIAIAAVDLQDIIADDDGGVVLLTRDAENGGTDGCGGGTLCGGESSPCRTMWMVRFNRSGEIEWETQVTNLSEDLAGYDNGARFIWWYQHHGRLAFDGENYAAYFGVAITVDGSESCIDIHQGDRMQVVSASGELLSSHPDAFEVGCSHAWQSRIVWDPREERFAMVCITDNACRVAQPNPYRTVAEGECDGTLFGGDLVLSSTPGYWTAWSQGGEIRLEHFTDGPSDLTVPNAGPSSHPHLVGLGADQMLLTWEAASSMVAQVRSRDTGESIGSEFPIAVPDHDFQAFKEYPDGSAAIPAAGTSNSSFRIARVGPCQ